ncbi:methionine ABC transporter ATP-binding protein [Brooklawnia cerclae]|uniref:D-methionine transport system ATP-binding protein n=1 Tax=Brooklawnia cerclae TaxID=349934 RepID=A0ABX0SF67_9ACTN|nr:methionine ABC transporter ATP-binding protein [Brooklawnia cerclae]NIH56650.1 D-methionine transport system ATP-binding protein [Brooklawnia cerclae]
MGATVSLRSVTKDFGTPSGSVRAVDDVSLDIGSGEVFGIIGYSGAGKSTLVRLINGLETPTSGTVAIDGQVITGLPERKLRPVRAGIGFVFQQFNLFSSRTVASNVGFPLRVAGVDKRGRERRVAELLDFVGLSDKAGQYPDQLSGGQKQRVGIARALATKPDLLLADEATSALDPETTRDVLDLLRRVNDRLGVTIAVITHEMAVVSYLCSRVAVMEKGRIVETGPVYDVFAAPQQPVTRRFVGTALHDRPRADVLARLRQRHAGRIVTVAVTDQNGSSTLLTEALRSHGVDGAVIHGGISEIDSRPLGALTLELVGSETAIEDLLSDLRRNTDVIDHGTAQNPVDAADEDGDAR